MSTERTVFISYARKDADQVAPDVELLRAGGVTVFIDVASLAPGDLWEQKLREALVGCDRVLLFWSRAAQVSEWVEREWRFALSLGKRIVPTLLDRTRLPAELARFNAVKRFRWSLPVSTAATVAVSLAALAMAAWMFTLSGADAPHTMPLPDVVATGPPASSSVRPTMPPTIGLPDLPKPPGPSSAPPVATPASRPQAHAPVGGDGLVWGLIVGTPVVALLVGFGAWRGRRARSAAGFVEQVFRA